MHSNTCIGRSADRSCADLIGLPSTTHQRDGNLPLNSACALGLSNDRLVAIRKNKVYARFSISSTISKMSTWPISGIG